MFVNKKCNNNCVNQFLFPRQSISCSNVVDRLRNPTPVWKLTKWSAGKTSCGFCSFMKTWLHVTCRIRGASSICKLELIPAVAAALLWISEILSHTRRKPDQTSGNDTASNNGIACFVPLTSNSRCIHSKRDLGRECSKTGGGDVPSLVVSTLGSQVCE